ncbi:MAG: hypothetical protein JXQ90_06980 [Cyclobacteriaceae bacterium]
MNTLKTAIWISMSYLLIVGLIGLWLRGMSVFNLSGIYTFIIHAHSHTAFMGWLNNVIFIVIVRRMGIDTPWTTKVFWWYQVACIGMLLSFPFQGYGPVSIAFSTLHVVVSVVFVVKVYGKLQDYHPMGKWIKAGMLFMLLSSLGPFALGPLSAMGYKTTVWYQLAIQHYLHFYYNGWFLMAMMGLVNGHLKVRNDRVIFWLMTFSMPLLLFTSVMFYINAWWVQLLSIAGSILFMTGVIMILKVWSTRGQTGLVWMTILICLLGKAAFQLLANLPGVAEWVITQRHVVIGYLHLNFLGLLTPLAFYLLTKELQIKLNRGFGAIIYVMGFILTELLLFISFIGITGLHMALFIASAIIVIGIVMFLISFIKLDLSHEHSTTN